ncbi:efflux RND transporter periplasmic adaptor subunit [Spartobacteria bacterium LR76]|nr:efflux RND transporter periplasmic adaptor subunit [Spartobacteria bacterium LR76]
MKILATILSASCLIATAFAADPMAVKTAQPVPATKASRYEVPGRTEPFESATIFTRATGVISERRYEIGDEVKAGDVLAVVAAPEVDRAVDAAKANVEQVKARAGIALSLSERSTRLLQSQVVSKEETEQRQTTASETAAAVRVAEAELAKLEEQQRFSTVIAPFDGVISERNFDRGDLARGDAAPSTGWLYQLDRLDTLRFAVYASPDLALRLGKEKEARVEFREFPGRTFTAKLAHVSRVFDTASGTMRIELLLDNKEKTLPAGLTGTATFDVTPPPNTFLVPTNALVSREGSNLVAIAEDGKVRFIEVLPGRNLGRNIEVMSEGLSANTPVILNPNAMLRDGDAIKAEPTPAVAGK